MQVSDEAALGPTIGGGRYRVLGPLGRGGAAEVLRVRDSATGRELALKRLRNDVRKKRKSTSDGRSSGPPSARSKNRDELRFRREFHTLAGLEHPNVIAVYDYGIDESGPYYTMELLDGQELHAIAPLDVTETCRVLRDVASALALLHARKLIHRDVSPRNVWRLRDGTVKLTDFGVLATMGLAREIAGTPPCIPPECLHRLPLDQRVDLYALGALGYWLLARRVAYPARAIRELEQTWRTRPAPLSSLVKDIPKPLEELIASLLSLDPLGRPSSAAEVIDRLTAIAKLPPLVRSEKARGHLGSASLVGRRRELKELNEILDLASKGSGGAAVVEAPSGMGKSRLMRESALEAKLRGLTALTVGAGGGQRGPYGLVQELTRSALTECADEAVDAARPHVRTLVRVLPELRKRFGHVKPLPLSGDPSQDRAEMLATIVTWLVDLAQRRPLAIFVDDVQRADEASVAVLAALARRAYEFPLALVVANRVDEEARAKVAIEAIADSGRRVRLRGLELRHVEQLVGTLFGDVPNVARVARAMHAAASGSPLLTVEIAWHLVDRGLIRYVDGTFVLPEEIKPSDLPSTLASALDARIRTLPRGAFDLGQALAVEGGELALSLAVALSRDGEEAAFVALDQLVQHEVLVGDGGAFEFRHDGVREAFLRSIPEAQLAGLHLRVGHAMLEETVNVVRPGREGTIGWHLLRGGETDRGAELLALAGQRFFESQSFADSIPPLEAALASYERTGRSPADCLALRQLIISAGTMSDRKALLRYAESTMETLAKLSGLDLAHKLARFLGRPIALGLSLCVRYLGRLFLRKDKRGPAPIPALRNLFVLTAYSSSAFSLAFDIEHARALARRLEPLSFVKFGLVHGARMLTECFELLIHGRVWPARDRAEVVLQMLSSSGSLPISATDRKHGEGAALQMIGSIDAAGADPAYLPTIERLEKLGLRFFDAGALVQRAVFHRMRGEEEIARDFEQSAEAIIVELGAVWVHDAQQVWMCALAYGFTRDLVGLRRAIESLQRLEAQGYRMGPFIELARGEYRRERGDLAQAEASLLRAIEIVLPGDGLVVQPALAALAETYLEAGKIELAIDAGQRAIEAARDPERGRPLWEMRARRVVALGMAARGELTTAAADLDRLIEDAKSLDCPTLTGGVHEARARVALAQGDRPRCEAEIEAMDRVFRATLNPALISRVDRLRDARHAPSDAPTPTTLDAITVRAGGGKHAVTRALAACGSSEARAERALEILLEEAAVPEGHLYVSSGRGLSHVAPAKRREPPEHVFAHLEKAVDEARSSDGIGTGDATTIEESDAAWHIVVLTATLEDRRVTIGAVAFRGAIQPISDEILRAVVRGLAEDASTSVPSSAT